MAIVRDGREVLANQILSQIDRHAVFGGVVPEIASRMHVEALDPLLDAALSEAGMTLEDIDAVAVTCGPGLVGALLTAVSYAKALAYARGLPLVAVNHIEGHVSANYLAHPDLEPPFCLSGGLGRAQPHRAGGALRRIPPLGADAGRRRWRGL